MSATSQLGFVSWDLFQMHSRLLVRVQKSNIETKIIEKNKKKNEYRLVINQLDFLLPLNETKFHRR